MTDKPSAEHRAPITLVTAFFAIADPHRNRTPRDYYAWMARLLPFIRWPMVVYCDAQSLDAIKRLRGQKPTVYRVTDLRDFFVYRYRDALVAHNKRCQLSYHADVCMVWHEKVNFMRRAIDENPFGSEMFFWCDIGLFRPHKTRAWFRLSERVEWPNWRVCRSAFADRVAFFDRTPVHIAPPPPPRDTRRIAGGFWGGSGGITRRFCDDYYRVLSRRINRGPVVSDDEQYGSEEYVMTAMADSGAFNIRTLSVQDVPYFAKLHPGRAWLWYVAVLYCLNGSRFPWTCVGREVSMLGYIRYAAKRICRRIFHTQLSP